MDDEDRDSSDDNSSREPLLDIPLPDRPIPKFTRDFTEASGDITGIPLPSSFPDRLKTKQSTMFFDEDSSDIPPLPPSPHDMVMNMMSSAREKLQDSRERHKDGKAMKRDKSLDDTDNSRDDDEDRARQTNTSLGPVTLHVNRKLVPRLSRASVFDLNDENAKEIGRKLLRLKRLRKLRKVDENAEHKIEAKERISMWKEELLGGSQLSVQENLAVPLTVNLLLENTLEKPSADGAVNAINLNLTANKECPTDSTSTIPENQVSNEAVDGTSLKGVTEPTLAPLCFVKVCSKNDQMEFNWPTEMILSTKLSPKLCYSCNPLEFDFGVASTSSIAADKPAKMETKEKRRKKKKSREYLSRRKSSERNDCKEMQKVVQNALNTGDRLHSTNSRSGSGHRNKKQSSSSSHQCSSGQLKEQSGTKDVHVKTKCNRGNGKRKQPSDALLIVDGKNKCNDTNSKVHKRNISVQRSGKILEPNKGRSNDLERSASSKLEQNFKPDRGKKRKLSGGDVKQLNKKPNISDVTKSAEVPQKGADGRISDFEDMECSGGPGKWDTSSGSELDMTSANLYLAAKTFKTGESGKQEQRDRRRRQSFTSSDRESLSSQDYSDSDHRSHRSHSRSRSYSSYSYCSSKRSYSYSSDSDYHRRHSHSSSSRSHSRRRHSYSYTDDSYHSKSRSRSKRSRSRSRSHGGRFRSYSSYSHSSRSYSRSRSRSRSRSYRRYSRSRSYYKDRRQSRSQRTARERHRQSKRNKCDPLPTLKSKSESNKSKKAEELVSSNVKLTISKSGQSNEGACLDNSKVAAISQPLTSEVTAAKSEEKNDSKNALHVDDNLKISEIPRPEEDVVVSIPLPTVELHKQADGSISGGVCLAKTISASKVAPSFIGPTLPVNHPLAHIQDIPVPKNEQFQPIGPNDPLVFKTPLHPPPPPPSFLTEPGSKFVGRDPPLPPRPRSPPPLPNDWSAMEDIAGNEEPIPHMLDLGAFKPAMIIPPEQADQYRALQHQAQLHARQRMREEAGIADEEDEEEASDEAQQQQQLIDDEMLIERAQNAYLAAQPVIHLPQPQLVAPTLGAAALPQVVLGNGGFFQVPMSMQMVSAGPTHGLVSLAPSMVPVLSQTGAPMVIAAHSAGAMSALIRAHEAQAQAQAEAAEEAEAQAKARAQASLFQGQAHEWIHIVQMPGSGQTLAVPAHALTSSVPRALAMSGLRSAGLQMHHGLIPVQSVNHPSLHQSALVQPLSLGLPMRVGLPSGVVGAPQIFASPAQQQGFPLLIDSSGSIFVPRLMRPGHL